MGNEALKVQTLRFVDVLPALNSSGSVVEHMQEYFKGNEVGLAAPLRFGLNMSRLTPWLVGPTVKKSVGSMARQFITGRTGAEAVPTLRKIRSRGVGFTVDILGEAVVSEREAQEYFERYLELIESLARDTKDWAFSEQLEGGAGGRRPMPKVNVSVKISALYSQIHPADPEGAIVHLKERLRPSVPPREGTRRVHQPGHGKLWSQKPHLEPVREPARRAGIRRLSTTPGSSSRRTCAIRPTTPNA